MTDNGFKALGLPKPTEARSVADQRDERVARATDNPMLGTADSRLVNNPPAVIHGVSASLVAAPGEPELGEETTRDRINNEFRNQQLADRGVGAVEGATMYSSHPIAKYRVGPFQFDRGLLKLDSKDAADFEALLKTLPATESSRISKIDVSAAERIVRDRLAAQSSATKNFDSTVGERAGKTPTGTGRLEDGATGQTMGHASQAQEDSNKPDAHALDTGMDVIRTEGQSDNG